MSWVQGFVSMFYCTHINPLSGPTVLRALHLVWKGWTSCWLARTPISGRHIQEHAFCTADQMSSLAIELLFFDKGPHHFVLQLANLLNWETLGYTKECPWYFTRKDLRWKNLSQQLEGYLWTWRHSAPQSGEVPRSLSQDLVKWAFPKAPPTGVMI